MKPWIRKNMLAATFGTLCVLNSILAQHTPMSDTELDTLILRAFEIKDELNTIGHSVEDRNTECLNNDDFTEIDAIMRAIKQQLHSCTEGTDSNCEAFEAKYSCDDITPLAKQVLCNQKATKPRVLSSSIKVY